MAERTVPRKIISVRVEADALLFNLDRHGAVALGLPDKLRSATPAQAANWTIIGDGQAVHWVDLDLTVPLGPLTLDPDRLRECLREFGVRDPDGAVERVFQEPARKLPS